LNGAVFLDYVKYLPLYPFKQHYNFLDKVYNDDFLSFFKSIYLSKFVELDFRYLDYLKYQYFSNNVHDFFSRYSLINSYKPDFQYTLNRGSTETLKQNAFVGKRNMLNLFDYWVKIKPSKRLTIMP